MTTHPGIGRAGAALAGFGRMARRRMSERMRASGQGLVEYALLLVLIAVVAIGGLTLVGRNTSQVFDQVNCALGNPASSSSHPGNPHGGGGGLGNNTTTTGGCQP